MSIERVSGLPIDVFHKEYAATSRPVIFADLLGDWPAMKKWTPEFFGRNYGDTKITAICLDEDRPNDPHYVFSNRHYKQMTISEYLSITQEAGRNGTHYLGDFPIFKVFPHLQSDIKPFVYWDNWFHRAKSLKGVFWMGPAGTVVPIHFEVRHNFFAQIYGRKKWVIASGNQHDRFYVPSDFSKKNFSPIDINNPDLEKYPKFQDTEMLELVLNPGEVLFLPAQWMHYVEALEYSISMNFWWHSLSQSIKNLPRDIRVLSPSVWNDRHTPIVN